MPWYKHELNNRYFNVESIRHEFANDEQLIFINLRAGDYNLFWHLRKDEGIEKGEISLHDRPDLEDYE